MNQNIIAFLFAFLFVTQTHAQKYLLSKDPAMDTTIQKWGANRAHYVGAQLALGFVADQGVAGAKTDFWRSSHFQFGFRYKRKLSNVFSIGTDLSWKIFTVGLKQEQGKKLPDTLLHRRQNVATNNFSLGGFLRINFDPKRGNKLGTFLDLGASADWSFFYSEFTKDKLPDGSFVDVSRYRTNTNEPISYYFNARLGKGKFALYALYRLSNWYKSSANFPEPARLFTGIQFGF